MIIHYRMDGSMFTSDYLTKAIVFIGCVTLVFYLWKFFAGTGELKDGVIYSNIGSGLLANSTKPLVLNNVTMPQLFAGGDFSISTWIYVTNWSINNGKNKVFLTLSGGGSTRTMVMYLGQNVNKLGIRVSSSAANSLDSTRFNSIIQGTTPYTDVAADFKMCDIETVDLQKWVNVTTILSGRTLDVYIDGKLSRSCVLDGTFTADGDVTTVTLGGTTPAAGSSGQVTVPNGFGGYIGQTRAANYAYSPDQVYTNYLKGPSDTSIWTQLLGSLNPKWFSSCQVNQDK